MMTGQEFEKFIAELFSKMGYEYEITKATGDQGIDVIVSKNGSRIGIQAKCYSGSVGNSAIQEAVAGKNHYRLDKAIVVTNNFFTDAAQQLAQSNSIILWDRNILKEKIDEIFNSSEK
jgi:HJR/Mrr/RecB family endonuclease